MEKTYTISCDFEITIKGVYAVCNMWEEDTEGLLSEDDIWDFLSTNLSELREMTTIKIFNRKTEEET